jgi:hypothetical protein
MESIDAITVSMNGDYSEEFVQMIEERIDGALTPVGFSRTGKTVRPDGVDIHLHQFARAL